MMTNKKTAGNLLVVGGSYFLGKTYLSYLSDNDLAPDKLYVLNRGSRPLPADVEQFPGLVHLRGDRRDAQVLRSLESVHFDAVVDFCGYNAGDIATLAQHLKAGVDRYVFISTVDVLARGTRQALSENSAYETRVFPGETGAYIAGKVALEKELADAAKAGRFEYTVLRPAVIYGPGNYAPRESMYFHWIREAGQVIHPEGATGHFQMVYVKDVARFLAQYALQPEAKNEVFHLCGAEQYTYDSYVDLLERATGTRIERVSMPVQDVIARGIPLPFPFYEEESETYLDTKTTQLGFTYTANIMGMQETYQDSSLRSE